MPGPAILATLATTLPAPTAAYALTIGGLNVLKDRGSGAARFGVDPGTVTIVENGPGGVSELSFDVDDPLRAISLTDGQEVALLDLRSTLTPPIAPFVGFLETAVAEAAFGDQARVFHVTCVGIEIMLDWLIYNGPDLTFPAGTLIYNAIASLYAQCTPAGAQLRVTTDTGAGLGSTWASPVAWDPVGMTVAVTIRNGTTLREGIRQITAAWKAGASHATVDFYRGLRVWNEADGADFYGNRIIIDETGVAFPSQRSEGVSYGIDSAAVRTVIARDGTGAVNVTVNDGSGKAGPAVILTDPTLTTVAAATAAAQAYLTANRATSRGQLKLTDTAPYPDGSPQPAGSHVYAQQITPLGLVGRDLGLITSIRKTFNPSGRENWTVDFGGVAPRLTAYIRRLTRAVISS